MALQVLGQICLDSEEGWSRGMEFATIPYALMGWLESLKSILRLRPIDIVGAVLASRQDLIRPREINSKERSLERKATLQKQCSIHSKEP